MRKIRSLVSCILLLTLALAFGQEAMGGTQHLDECATSFQTHASEESEHHSAALEACDNSDTTNHRPSEDCKDPCHVGHCHFGHCFFISAKANLNELGLIGSQVQCAFSQNRIDGPSLDGLRRPPRHS